MATYDSINSADLLTDAVPNLNRYIDKLDVTMSRAQLEIDEAKGDMEHSQQVRDETVARYEKERAIAIRNINAKYDALVDGEIDAHSQYVADRQCKIEKATAATKRANRWMRVLRALARFLD